MRSSIRLLCVLAIAGASLTALGTPGHATAGSAGRPASAIGLNPRTHLRPGLMPLRPSGPTNFSAPAGAQLNYYGGPVLRAIDSVPVAYGSGTYLDTNGAGITSFTSQLLGSGVLDWLSGEYNTSTQTIGRGTMSSIVSITPSSADNGSSITDGQIQSEIAAQITAHNLPAPDANTSYALFFRNGQSICDGGSCSLAAGGFCAYHGTMTLNSVTFTYQVMPDLSTTAGCGNGTAFENTTSVLSHELAETITDPDVGFATTFGPPLGWYDPANGEIADICGSQVGTFVGSDSVTYLIQKLFSNANLNCIVGTPVSATTSVTVSANPSSSVVGQKVALTASVSSTTTPTSAIAGRLRFYDGSTLLGTKAFTSGGTATLNTTKLTVGSHTITAAYQATSTSATSTSPPLTFVVSTASTTVTLSAAPTKGTAATNFVLRFSVHVVAPGRARAYPGTVVLYDNGSPLTYVSLTTSAAGKVVETFSAGSHAITAYYLGDSDLAPSPASNTKTLSVQ